MKNYLLNTKLNANNTVLTDVNQILLFKDAILNKNHYQIQY